MREEHFGGDGGMDLDQLRREVATLAFIVAELASSTAVVNAEDVDVRGEDAFGV